MNKWLASIAIQKVIKRVISFSISAVIAGLSRSGLEKAGVNVTIDPAVATGAAFGGVEFARNFVKTKWNIKWL